MIPAITISIWLIIPTKIGKNKDGLGTSVNYEENATK
jgi:hypothetical protein